VAKAASDIRERIAEFKVAGTTAACFSCHLHKTPNRRSRFRLYEYLLHVRTGAGFFVLFFDYLLKRLLQTMYGQWDFVAAK
jgi:hypothetical protein